MPNFITSDIKSMSYPKKIDEITYHWEADGLDENLIFCEYDDEKFLISKIKRGNSWLFKGSKSFKPTKVFYLQNALIKYANFLNLDITLNCAKPKKNRLSFNPPSIINIDECLKEIDKYENICIEIGFGSGRHLLARAKEEKDTLFIGLEIYKPAIEQVAKLGINFSNLKLINFDARILFDLIKSNKIDKIYMHFPVPWEKDEHKRVISEKFALQCQRILKKDGVFELRTDSEIYFEFSKNIFSKFKNINVEKNKPIFINSKYEDRWLKQKKDIYELHFICDEISGPLEEISDFSFGICKNNNDIFDNFQSFSIKLKNSFLHLHKIYKINSDSILISLSLGAFSSPQKFIVLIKNNNANYLISKPLRSIENLEAHNELKRYLCEQ